MSLLSVVKDVCAVVGVLQPTSVFSNIGGNRTMQEMLACANESAQAIAYDTREWTKLRATATLVGDGVTDGVTGIFSGTEGFDLPANYRRMLLRSNVWMSTRTQTPLRFIPDADEWIKRRINGSLDGCGEWTMYGGEIHIQPIMPVGVTAHFVYLDKNCVTIAAGGFNDTFTDDADTFRLDERLFKLYMIWRWKALKGTSYAEDLSTYGDALNSAGGADQPAPIIFGRLTPTHHYGGWYGVN
jgi:hypothetical protein